MERDEFAYNVLSNDEEALEAQAQSKAKHQSRHKRPPRHSAAAQRKQKRALQDHDNSSDFLAVLPEASCNCRRSSGSAPIWQVSLASMVFIGVFLRLAVSWQQAARA